MINLSSYSSPLISHPLSLFKGIALFTPGGDLIYCIDPSKQAHWHLHLCAGLQKILGLPEPPHFLIPCYTATIDHWLNPRTQKVQTFTEAYPLVMQHQALLNAVFASDDLVWQAAPWQEVICDPIVLASYRDLFPQLWENHDLIVQWERSLCSPPPEPTISSPVLQRAQHSSYVLRLFVAGYSANTERILQSLHQILEQHLRYPYTLKVIDVLQHPEQAEVDQISATPTLVRVSPEPMRRLVGDLDNVEKILQMLSY